MGSPMNSLQYSQYISQSLPQHSQTPTQSQHEVGSQKVKNVGTTTWDDKTSTFINLCVVEVRAGNRPGIHFSSVGWKNIVEKFNMATNLNYTRIQLKNHWDHLKRMWKEWRRLLRNETGLGWDYDKGTIDATDEWWNRKIKEAPEVAKFKDKGPLLVAEQEYLFDDVIVTGSRIWVPISGVLPPHMQEDDHDFLDKITEIINTEDSVPVRVEPLDDEGPSLTRKRAFPNVISKKSKKTNTGETIAKSFSAVVELIKNKQAASNSRPLAPQYTIKECLDVLEKVNGIEEGDEMWLLATNLFSDPTNRELFLLMKKDETRLTWLNRQMEKDKLKNARFYQSGQDLYGQSRDNASSR